MKRIVLHLKGKPKRYGLLETSKYTFQSSMQDKFLKYLKETQTMDYKNVILDRQKMIGQDYYSYNGVINTGSKSEKVKKFLIILPVLASKMYRQASDQSANKDLYLWIPFVIYPNIKSNYMTSHALHCLIGEFDDNDPVKFQNYIRRGIQTEVAGHLTRVHLSTEPYENINIIGQDFLRETDSTFSMNYKTRTLNLEIKSYRGFPDILDL